MAHCIFMDDDVVQLMQTPIVWQYIVLMLRIRWGAMPVKNS